MNQDEWLAEFHRNLERTESWLRKRHGERMIDGRTVEDFLQDAAIAIWARQSDPRYMQRKAALQQKTFFKRRVYRKPKSIPMSAMDRPDSGSRDGDSASVHLFIAPVPNDPCNPTNEDWDRLKRDFNLRDTDIDMLKMRTNGMPAREIARIVGITTNSVHVRISDMKMRMMGIYKMRSRTQ